MFASMAILSLSSSMFAPTPQLSSSPTRGKTALPRALRVTAVHDADRKTACPSTLYDVLRVPKTASAAHIRAAYRSLARRYHPDVLPAAEREAAAATKRFLQIHSAYVALCDAEARRRYDLQLAAHAVASARVSGPFTRASSSGFSPLGGRGNYGRSWETDQCWC